MKCRTCARRLDLEKLDYTVGCKHEQMEGFVCLACAHEGVAYWMTNTSEDNYCEEYVEKQVKGKLMNVEIPTKRESEEAEKQVKGDLISRQAVIDFVGSMEMTDQISADAYKELIIYLEGLLSEPVGNPEQLKGKWIESETYGFICSECGSGYKGQPTIMGKPIFEFCPICGADMRGEKDDKR